MAQIIEFETERLRLRQWQPADLAPFAALNADTRVMEYFPSALTSIESDRMAERCQALIAERGWGLWAADSKATREFIGYVGLHVSPSELPFAPSVEIGWRLAFQYWGRGFASEAAKEVSRVAFRELDLPQIVSFTAIHNHRSRAVMERIGMQESGTFEHPALPHGHALRLHCLYILTRAACSGSCFA